MRKTFEPDPTMRCKLFYERLANFELRRKFYLKTVPLSEKTSLEDGRPSGNPGKVGARSTANSHDGRGGALRMDAPRCSVCI